MTTSTTQVYRTSNVFLAPAVIVIFAAVIVRLTVGGGWRHSSTLAIHRQIRG